MASLSMFWKGCPATCATSCRRCFIDPVDLICGMLKVMEIPAHLVGKERSVRMSKRVMGSVAIVVAQPLGEKTAAFLVSRGGVDMSLLLECV